MEFLVFRLNKLKILIDSSIISTEKEKEMMSRI